jgi:hypothetical protein
MISSPCRTCEKKNEPKENCYKDCKIIKAVQEFDRSANRYSPDTGIDCSEENRFAVRLSAASSAAALA